MKSLRHIFQLLSLAVILTMTLGSCIEDGITTSPAAQPEFSTDTVQMGNIFTLYASPTHRFTVHNRNDKGINISRIAFADDPQGNFRLNVDGVSAREFNNMEIRGNDSIFIFVEATLPENGKNTPVDIIAHIEFLTNGVSSRLPVKATGRDAVRLKGNTRFSGSETLSPEKPYFISDSIVIEPNSTLTIPAGTELYFHDDAAIVVHGTLNVDGTSEAPVSMTGDRSGFVAAAIPYEVMSGQWRGIEFTPTSKANRIVGASIRNSADGLTLDHVQSADGAPALRIVNSQVRNTKSYVLHAIHSDVEAAGCEFTDASSGIVRLVGGNHSFNHCTFANYYLFTALGGPALQFAHVNSDDIDDEDNAEDASLPFLTAEISNCIIYGNGSELSHSDLDGTEIYLRNTLLKSSGPDDEHFIGCIWDKDPMYFTERLEYIFDYRVKPESPAIGAGDPSLISPLTLTDRFGTQRNTAAPTIGAYEFSAEEE